MSLDDAPVRRLRFAIARTKTERTKSSVPI